MPTAEALQLAEENGVDLVEIAPMARPPVCRLMDYGKFKYQEAKRAHEAKQKQKKIEIKEIKLRPGTDENDYQVKLRSMLRFLQDGDKVKITLRFRGREMSHQDIGVRQLERIKTDIESAGFVEQMPKMEGRQMVMMIAPGTKKETQNNHSHKSDKTEKNDKSATPRRTNGTQNRSPNSNSNNNNRKSAKPKPENSSSQQKNETKTTE